MTSASARMELPFWNHVPRAVTGLLLTSVSPATLMKAFWAPKSYPTPKELLSAAECVLSRRAGYNVMRVHGVSFAHGRAGCSCLYERKIYSHRKLANSFHRRFTPRTDLRLIMTSMNRTSSWEQRVDERPSALCTDKFEVTVPLTACKLTGRHLRTYTSSTLLLCLVSK